MTMTFREVGGDRESPELFMQAHKGRSGSGICAKARSWQLNRGLRDRMHMGFTAESGGVNLPLLLFVVVDFTYLDG